MGVSDAGFAERVLRTYKHTVTHSGARACLVRERSAVTGPCPRSLRPQREKSYKSGADAGCGLLQGSWRREDGQRR